MNVSQIIEAISVMAEEGGAQDVIVLSLIDRLLADDWTDTGVYEALDAALTKAESDLDDLENILEDDDSIHGPMM